MVVSFHQFRQALIFLFLYIPNKIHMRLDFALFVFLFTGQALVSSNSILGLDGLGFV